MKRMNFYRFQIIIFAVSTLYIIHLLYSNFVGNMSRLKLSEIQGGHIVEKKETYLNHDIGDDGDEEEEEEDNDAIGKETASQDQGNAIVQGQKMNQGQDDKAIYKGVKKGDTESYDINEKQTVVIENNKAQSEYTARMTTENNPKTKKGHHHFDVGIKLAEKYNIGTDVNEKGMFPYLLNNPSICSYQEIFYLVLVMSSPDNFERRHDMRRTWAQKNLLDNFPSVTVFILGQTNNRKITNRINQESKEHGDIIQADFKDSYHNLTLKSLVGIKWAFHFCQNAKFILRTDDDIFVDVLLMTKVLNEHFSNIKRGMLGYFKANMTIFRENETDSCGKWCIAWNDYPNYHKYPTFIRGSFYILTPDILEHMYNAAVRITYHWVEDAFLTGFVRTNLENVTFINLAKYYLTKRMRFARQYEKHVEKRTKFVTWTPPLYEIWKAFLTHLTPSDKHIIGDVDKYTDLMEKLNKMKDEFKDYV